MTTLDNGKTTAKGNYSPTDSVLVPKHLQDGYIVNEVGISLLLAISLYMFVNLFAFGFRTGKWKSSTSSEISKGTVFTSLVVASSIVFLCFVAGQFNINSGFIDTGMSRCDVYSKLSTCIHGVSHVAVCTFLWTRQRVLYLHPCSQVEKTWPFVVSWAVLALIVLGGTVYCILLIVVVNYIPTDTGCNIENPRDAIVPMIFGSAGLVIIRGSILLLLVYVLRLHRSDRNEKRIGNAIRRSVTSTLLSVGIDFIYILYNLVVYQYHALIAGTTLALGITLVASFLASSYTFENWLLMLNCLAIWFFRSKVLGHGENNSKQENSTGDNLETTMQ